MEVLINNATRIECCPCFHTNWRVAAISITKGMFRLLNCSGRRIPSVPPSTVPTDGAGLALVD